MNTMNSYSSSPALAHGTPPVTSPITQNLPETPAVSPSDAQPQTPLELDGSKSPRMSLSNPANMVKLGDIDQPKASHEMVELSIPLKSPLGTSSASSPAGRITRLPLEDSSQYLDQSPTRVTSSSSTSLTELAHLMHLEKHQQQMRTRARLRLHHRLVSSALSARLTRCGDLAYRALVDCFRKDDKKNFATLYNAVHDVRSSCDAARQYYMLDSNSRVERTTRVESSPPMTNFMQQISSTIRTDILNFLSKLRSDPEFLAGRIMSLSHTELSSLTSFHTFMETIDSVMASHTRGKTKAPTLSRLGSSTPTPVERLLSFQRHDPLSALLHTSFANSGGPDSSEDLRRTEVWSIVCSRLINESKSGAEQFIGSILNAWTAMREWPLKPGLELYLMKILQDGAFLLESNDTKSAAPRGNTEARNIKESIAAEEFYEAAVLGLFKILDEDLSSGGIPEGALELGTAILRKLDSHAKYKTALRFIVSRWFFTQHLSHAIIHPESFGMMIGYHINEGQRQTILRNVAGRASKAVVDMNYNLKQGQQPVLPEIRSRVDKLMARFGAQKSARLKPRLQSTTFVTSPRETNEIQPFLAVSAADIVTLVNALYPERRLSSSSPEHNIQKSGRTPLSAASSLSAGSSLPLQMKPLLQRAPDTSSMLSNSGSSIASDLTSREPLLDTLTDAKSSTTSLNSRDTFDTTHKVSSEEYGYYLRMMVDQMGRILGPDALNGSCHPCAEKWAILYVSPDGKHLRMRTRKDEDDEEEEDDEESPDSDSEDETATIKTDIERDYHSMKETILLLLDQYEIPKALAPEIESKSFSNRSSNMLKGARRVGGTISTSPNTLVEGLPSRNPYHRQSQLSTMITGQKVASSESQYSQNRRKSASGDGTVSETSPSPLLVTLLETAIIQCRENSNFMAAHRYWKALTQLRRLSPSLAQNGYESLLNYFSRSPRDSLIKCATAMEEFEAWFVWLDESQSRQDTAIENMTTRLTSLRDKMWYITDVKNSAAYEDAKNVTTALINIGNFGKAVDGKVLSMAIPRPKTSSSHFLLKTDTQYLDLMKASPDYSGPNKLSDEQSEKTLKWLNKFSVANFCKGEERIHRFCVEIDHCVNKIVGDTIMQGPVLWSSELYFRDKRILESGRQKGDLFLTGVGTLSISGDEEYEMHGHRSAHMIEAANRASTRDLRSSFNRNMSQQSFDSGRWNAARSIGTPNVMDSQDYFGSASPVLNIDSSQTFWTPFKGERTGSPTESSTGTAAGRPRNSSLSQDTVLLRTSESVNSDKKRFLWDLKQTITGLLLSDLGIAAFSRGSETDSWFAGDLAEECINRHHAREKRRKRTLAKKRSTKSLKASRSDQKPLLAAGSNRSDSNNRAEKPNSNGEATSSSSDAAGKFPGLVAGNEKDLVDFPYNSAFRNLLDLFSTHPNPFTKLRALHDLEQLIVSSLQSRSNNFQPPRRESLNATNLSPTSPTFGEGQPMGNPSISTQQPRNIEETIANIEERRLHSMTMGGGGSPSQWRKSWSARSPRASPSTDMIVDVLKSLFRAAEMRPKRLFRDLQFIASFIPANILNNTERGRAFWNVGLAALCLKQDVCGTMVELADQIVMHHTKNRERGQSQAARSVEPDEFARFSMGNAAEMYTITAKEGDPTAARELATFYLTHPDLLQRTVLPLSRPKEIFRTVTGQRSEDPTRSNPVTMCVAYHWMEQAQQGGDDLAKKYLRQREEFNAIG